MVALQRCRVSGISRRIRSLGRYRRPPRRGGGPCAIQLDHDPARPLAGGHAIFRERRGDSPGRSAHRDGARALRRLHDADADAATPPARLLVDGRREPPALSDALVRRCLHVRLQHLRPSRHFGSRGDETARTRRSASSLSALAMATKPLSLGWPDRWRRPRPGSSAAHPSAQVVRFSNRLGGDRPDSERDELRSMGRGKLLRALSISAYRLCDGFTPPLFGSVKE